VNGVDLLLLCLASVLVLGSIGGVLFTRIGLPDALCLVAAGVILGPALGLVDRGSLTSIAPFLGAITIIMVLFDGGSRLELGGVLRGSLRATGLALAGFAVSTVVVTVVVIGGIALGMLPSDWNWRYGLLIGVILGGSSSVVVMPAVIQARLPASVTNLVSTESALTDILCVVGATSLLALMVATAGSAPDPAASIGITFGIGLAAGSGVGLARVLFAGALRSGTYAYPMLLATLLLLYAVVDANRGSGALAVLIFALLVGNLGFRAPMASDSLGGSLDDATRSAHGQITFIVKALFFTFMGAMVGRPSVAMAFGVGLGLVLVLARILAVRFALIGSSLDPAERGIVGVLSPRGLAAGVLATFPVTAGLKSADQMPEIVYAAVITTIVAFAVLLPGARRRVNASHGPVELPENTASLEAGPA
jgi:cell volume regulation protein A